LDIVTSLFKKSHLLQDDLVFSTWDTRAVEAVNDRNAHDRLTL